MSWAINSLRMLAWDMFHKFRPLERLTLDSLHELLTEQAKVIFVTQLREVSRVDRFSHGREVLLYRRNKAEQHQEKSSCFLNRSEDVHLATALIKTPEEIFKVRVFMVRGSLFQLLIDKKQPTLDTPLEVISAILHVDPMAKIASATEQQNQSPIRRPAELVALENGTGVVNGWKILHERDIREIALGNANWFIVAEKDGVGAICVTEESALPHFFSYNQDGDGVPIKVTLAKFLALN